MDLTLETERLILRLMAPDDVESHIKMMLDPCVVEFLSPDGKPQSRELIWRAFASMLGHWCIRGFGMFSAFERETGDWVGRVGPWMPEGWPGLECG